MRDLFKYDRFFLIVGTLSLANLILFLYYLGGTHQNAHYCNDSFSLHAAAVSLSTLALLVALLAIYSYIRVTVSSKFAKSSKMTNGQLFSLILGSGMILSAIGIVWAVIEFGLNFGNHC